MDEAKFTENMNGTLIPISKGIKGFCPHPLPPEIDYNRIFGHLEKVSMALGGLEQLAKTLQDAQVLISPLQRKEALRSSSMEGTHSTADDLALVQAHSAPSNNESAQEVFNYMRALVYAQEQMQTLPLSHRVIKGMHAILLEGLSKNRGADYRVGHYKTEQNWIGARTIDAARFIPPPPQVALDCMDDLERFMNRAPDCLPALISVALIHYQFEAIHPFADGNGRIGRMLVPLYLMQAGIISQPLLYLSPHIEKHKDEYIDRMFNVSATGDWASWLVFFLSAIEKSCESTIETIHKLNDLRQTYRERLQKQTRSTNALVLCDYLFERPIVSIPDVQKKINTTYPAAQNTVMALCKNGILAPIQGRENPKLFRAGDIIRLSDEP